MKYNLEEIIKEASQARESWLKSNYPQVYNEVLEYTINLDITFKQKLWHYKNQIQYNIICKNEECNNLVKFKGSWTYGYRTFCCSNCATKQVEEKKALLNYSRKAKHTKEEKEQILLKKKERKQQISLNKQLKLEEKNRIANMSDDEYFNLYDNHNISGIYTKEKWLKANVPCIYNRILQYDGDISEKVYRFRHNITETPKCKQCKINDVIFKDKTIGFQEYCCGSCATIGTKDKYINTIREKYGVNSPYSIPKNIEKRKLKLINKMQEKVKDEGEVFDYNSQIYKIKCVKCNEIHENHISVLRQRLSLGFDWRDCITKDNSTSGFEEEIAEYIKSIYFDEIILQDRKILNKKEIDILLPKLKIGFEHNGVFWHNELYKEPYYHYDKYKLAKEKDIKLIQIYEDEWMFKKEIVKSRIKNILNLNENKIYARKCEIKEIKEFNVVKEFLEANHLQGSVNSSINIGLFHDNELVSLMTFGKARSNMKNDEQYELYRFSNKLYTSVIGGASKLFNYFINTYLPESIYSFSSNEWPGNLYYILNMSLKSENKLSYWYVNKKKRISRHFYNKQNLIKMGYDKNKSERQIMNELKIPRIYGAGNKTFIWYKNKKEN